MFKIGEIIKIKSAAEIRNEEKRTGESPGFHPPMDDYCDKKAKIVHEYLRKPNHVIHRWFYLNIDGEKWVWSANWLEKVNKIKLDDNLFEI